MWEIALAAALAPAQADAGAEPPPDRIAALTGYVSNWGSDPDDWFRFSELDAKLLIPRGGEREMYWMLLEAVDRSGMSLRVRVDAAAGRLAPSGDHLVYPVCSVALATTESFGDEARNCPPVPPSGKPHERLLALGLAASQEHPEAARRLLAAALAARPALPPPARAIAHKARADAAETLAGDFEAASPEHDRLMADALADYRRIAELLPDRPAMLMGIARALRALGAYEEALQAYAEVGRLSPDHAFEVAVQSGAIYREQGDYARALAMLDDYLPAAEPQEHGMKFNYHRAWTLRLLGREEEALRHLDAGLAAQPDYASAYQMRSCVRARLGRLEPALADQRRALELLAGMGGTNGWTREAAAQGRRAAAALEMAIADGRSDPVTGPCEEMWNRWQRPRPRSALLPPAG